MLLRYMPVLVVLAFASLTRPTMAEQIGPSFDCRSAQQPLAQMLCADPDLSRTDLRFAQAYFALLRQVGDAGKRDLKQEDLQFLEAVQRQCGIPVSGQAAPQSESARNCVKNAYEAQRAVWVLRLTPPLSEEANRPIDRHIALQRSLQQLGFLPADALIDGVYGAGSREAIAQWQRSQNRNATGVLADADASTLEQQASRTGQATAFIEPRPSGASDPQKPSASANPRGSATAAGATEKYTDPLAYCRTVGTINRPDSSYTGPEVPISMAAALEFFPETEDHLEWRCANGKLLACVSSNAAFCHPVTEAEKTRTPTAEMVKFCRERPKAGSIGYNVAGSNNLYRWWCEGTNAKIAGDLNTVDEQGYNASKWQLVSEGRPITPEYNLWRSSAAGDIPAIQRALTAGAEINSKTRNGHTALSLAVSSDRIAAAKYLLEHGADDKWVDRVGGTLISIAASPTMVDLLVDHGVDPNRADNNGSCPIIRFASADGLKKKW